MRSSANIMEIFTSIQGEGLLVGETQLFVRFYGCNLACRYCDTRGVQGPVRDCRVEKKPCRKEVDLLPNPVGAESLIETIEKAVEDRSLHHSIVFTGGEPLLQTDLLIEVLPVISREIPVMMETNGTLYRELEQISPWIDTVSMDVKIPSSTGEAADWEGNRLFLKACLDKNLYVKAVVSPDLSGEEIRSLTALIAGVDPSIPLVLQPLSGTEGDAHWACRILEVQAFCRQRLSSVRTIPQIHKWLKIQ
jgi:7-carboxy-7-deazaguanine synthase